MDEPDISARVPSRPLLASTLWAIGGTGFYYACQLGVLVLLAKFTTPNVQGQYVFALALATPVVLFFGLELRSAFVSDAGGQFALDTYLALRRRTLLLAAAVLLGILGWQAVSGQSGVDFLLILAGMFAARIFWGWAELGWGVYQRRERLDLLGISVGLRGVALIVPFAVLLPLYSGRLGPERLAEGAALAALVHAVALAALWFWFDCPRVRESAIANPQSPMDRGSPGGSPSQPALRALALQTLPLGVVALVINLCDTFPRLVIEAQPDGKTLLGYFGALAYITLAGNLVVIQAATAAANRLALHYHAQDTGAFLRVGAQLVAAAAVIGAAALVIALLCGDWILRTLYTPDYARFVTEFQIIVFAHCLALLTNVFGAATTQMRLFWVQVPAQAVTLACTIGAALVLIPGPHPVRGAADTILVRAVVQLVLYAACVGFGLSRRRRAEPRS
jgi:O-antigen/teichoic acid export membrane protein